MCGRYSLLARRADLVRAFPRLLLSEDYDAAHPPRYNVAPSQPVATITNREPSSLTMLPWGLPTGRTGSAAINARGDDWAFGLAASDLVNLEKNFADLIEPKDKPKS